MIKNKIKIWGIIAIIVALNGFSYPTAYSTTSEDSIVDTQLNLLDQYIDDNLSLGRCVYEGNIDFVLFLQTIIFSDGFFEGVIEPFRDIFSRNQCQSSDVLNLIKQRDKIRASIREAFLNCRNERIPMLKRAYILVNAEIYYVRHVVDGVLALALPYDLLSTLMIQNDSALYTNPDELYKTMKSRYVGENLSEIDFDVFFKGLQANYKSRKKQYVSCENGDFKRVAEKFQEFVDTLGGLAPAYQDFTTRVGGRAEKIAEALTDQSLADYLTGLVTVNINNTTPAIATEDFLEYVKKYGSFPSATGGAYNALLSEVGTEEIKYYINLIKSDLSGKFSVLYRDVGDRSIESFIEELQDFNQTILSSLDSMDKVYECSSSMNSRQCPNK